MRRFIALLFIAAGITVTMPRPGVLSVDLLNSDPTLDLFTITIAPPTNATFTTIPDNCTADLVCTLHAPAGEAQHLDFVYTTTVTPLCGSQAGYSFDLVGRVGDQLFDRVGIGGTVSTVCAHRVYLPQ